MALAALERIHEDALAEEKQAAALVVSLERRYGEERHRRRTAQLGVAGLVRSAPTRAALLADADRRGLALLRDAGAALERLEKELSAARTQLAEHRARRRAIELIIDRRRNKERIRRDRIEEEELEESNARNVKERYFGSP